MVAPCQYNFNTRTSPMGKTSVAPKKSKTTTAWWPASHWKNMPLAMKCQISNEKSQIFPNTNLERLQKLLATYNFAASLFCTQSPLKIILHPASWWLSHRCHSCASAFAVKISDQMGQRTCTAWKKHFGTLLLQLQQSHPCELARLEWLPRQAKLPLHGGRRTTGRICHWPWNVKSTIRKNRASPTQTWIALEKLVQPRGFTFLQYTSSIEDHFKPWQPATVPQLWFLCSRICCKDLGSNGLNNKHSSEEQWLHLASTTSTLAPVRWVKPVWLRKSKTTTVWWLASHWKNMRLTMKCQISNEKSQICPNSNLDRLQKLLPTYNFAASLFCTQSPFKIILHPARWWLSHRCHSCAAVFAVKI